MANVSGQSPDAPRFHRLHSVEVVGGFLDGMQCDFTDGLNCFIGARGTGKTTALEFVRYALDDMPEGDADGQRKRIDSLIKQNLAGGRSPGGRGRGPRALLSPPRR